MMRRANQELARLIEQALRFYRPDLTQAVNQLPGGMVAPATGTTPGAVTLSDDDPAGVGDNGSAAPGTASEVSRADHVHALPLSGVTPGVYGSASEVAQITVDAEGRVTSASEVTISVSGAPSGPAGGDLDGTYPDPDVVALQNVPVAATTPADADRLRYHATAGQWQPSALRWEPVASGGEIVFDEDGDVVMAEA